MSESALVKGAKHVAEEVARLLLAARVVSIDADNLFTYASGIRSPMYCDLRLLMGYPQERAVVTSYLVGLILEVVPFARLDVVAAVATAGIPYGAWVAERLGLPMVYVREQAKEHGRQQQIEGRLQKGWRAVVVEDLVTTGGSALTTVRALREAGLEVEHCVSAFSYGFERARVALAAEVAQAWPLTTVRTYLEVAQAEGAITERERHAVEAWLEEQG